jgi:hypothetical protein
MKLKGALFGVAAMLILAATQSKAQTVIAGSSALYLEMQQASYLEQGCSWTTSSKTFTLNDSRLTLAVADTATAWITWQPSGSCATPVAGSETVYLSTDSTVGNRCFFASPACTITTTSTSGTAGSGTPPGVTDTPLPAAVLAAVQGASVNIAATDVRPEDAKFATLRALTACGTPVVSGSQYLGLGYSNGYEIKGSTAQTNGSGGGFNTADFNLEGTDPLTGASLPGNFIVTPVAATPVVVVVNPGNSGGFGSLLVSNVDRATLAGYLDGTYGATSDAIAQAYASGGAGVTVYLREPLSGTYNTMEYAIPNSVQNQTSQEIGLAAYNALNNTGNPYPKWNCSTSNPNQWGPNPLAEVNARNSGVTSYRYRAIGTGNELKAVQATTDSLGYAFWSAANFAGATAGNDKYLTVDGIDPLQQDWTDGLVPTAGNDLLGNVSLAHIKDGSYPIWSILRLVSSPANKSKATALASDAAKFLSPSQPDFVPLSQLAVVRSHFAPPGVNFPSAAGANTPSNGSGATAEAGGDVAGLVYSLQADGSYNSDNGISTGNTGHRQ